jgi:hypothetical protein
LVIEKEKYPSTSDSPGTRNRDDDGVKIANLSAKYAELSFGYSSGAFFQGI